MRRTTRAPVTVSRYPSGYWRRPSQSSLTAPSPAGPPLGSVVDHSAVKTPVAASSDQPVGVPATTRGCGASSARGAASSTLSPVAGRRWSRTMPGAYGQRSHESIRASAMRRSPASVAPRAVAARAGEQRRAVRRDRPRHGGVERPRLHRAARTAGDGRGRGGEAAVGLEREARSGARRRHARSRSGAATGATAGGSIHVIASRVHRADLGDGAPPQPREGPALEAAAPVATHCRQRGPGPRRVHEVVADERALARERPGDRARDLASSGQQPDAAGRRAVGPEALERPVQARGS